MKKVLIFVISIALIASFAVGCSRNAEQPEPSQNNEEQQEQQPQFVEREIVLFYPDGGNNFLLHEFRKVTVKEDIAVEDMVRIVLGELVKGTDNSELKSIVPRETEILSVKLDDDEVTIEFSEEFLAMDYSNKEKKLQTYSVVNSLSELGIKKVNILVKGNPIEEYYTVLADEMPFSRNDELMPSK